MSGRTQDKNIGFLTNWLNKKCGILVGEVREGGAPYGKVIGILSFGHSVERNSGTFFMTLPGIGPEGQSMTCILGYGINWTFFDDEGNLILPQVFSVKVMRVSSMDLGAIPSASTKS